MLSHENVEQIHHIARMAVLAMCARGVAGSEFDSSPEVLAVRILIGRSFDGSEFPVDLEFLGASDIPIGGMSI